MWDAIVDEALTNIAVSGCTGRNSAGDSGFFFLTFWAVGEKVVGVASAHDAGTGEGEGNARGIDGDPIIIQKSHHEPRKQLFWCHSRYSLAGRYE